jgi:FkbM family methyltransferase
MATIPDRGAVQFVASELPDTVRLTEFSLQNDARAEQEGPIRIVTSAQQWAYAAVWRIDDVDPLCRGAAAEFVLRVEVTVDQGRIGVAIARADLAEFIGVEKECEASPHRQTIECRIGFAPRGMHLVLRNAAPNDTVSAVFVHRIQAYFTQELAGQNSPHPPLTVFPSDPPPIAGVPEFLPQGGRGTEVFETPEARRINLARLDHLARMGLQLERKSVLDVGCGVGHLSRFFTERGCRVTCVDARSENLARLKAIYPGTDTHVVHAERNPLANLGRFDVVFCYGMLYHTENPIAALRNMASCCRELLLLETVVTDHPLPLAQLVDEPNSTNNQAASGFGCRPTAAFVAMALTRMGFGFVYTSSEQPDFADFQFSWKGDGAWKRDGHLLRRVFVASRTRLSNHNLTLLLEAPALEAEPVFHPLAAEACPKIWLDVGAHLGEKTFSFAASNRNIRVYAFEPNLDLALPSMGRLANYLVLPWAVSESDGFSPFYMNRFDAASSLLPFEPNGLAQWKGGEVLAVENTVTVPTIRLDTFLNRAGISRVSYLKIDAQGGDLAVVRSLGERLRDVERISLEVQTAPTPLYRGAPGKDEVLQVLGAAGFELVSCEKQSHDQEENLTFVQVR